MAYNPTLPPVFGPMPNQPPNTVAIPSDAWRSGGAEPVPLNGQGIYMYGRGMQYQPEAIAPWTPAVEAQREAVQSQRRIEAAIAQAPVGKEMEAMQRALQLEGVLGFEADRKAGVPVLEALKRWAPKIYANNGAAVAKIAAVQEPFTPSYMDVNGYPVIKTGPNAFKVVGHPPVDQDTSPIQASDVMLNGKRVAAAVRRPSGVVDFIKEPKSNELQPAQAIALGKILLEQKDKEIKEAKYLGKKADPAIISTLEAEKKAIINKLASLQREERANPVASTPIAAPVVAPPVVAPVASPVAKAGSQAAPELVTTKAQYDALPPGTVYITPKGKISRKD